MYFLTSDKKFSFHSCFERVIFPSHFIHTYRTGMRQGHGCDSWKHFILRFHVDCTANSLSLSLSHTPDWTATFLIPRHHWLFWTCFLRPWADTGQHSATVSLWVRVVCCGSRQLGFSQLRSAFSRKTLHESVCFCPVLCKWITCR